MAIVMGTRAPNPPLSHLPPCSHANRAGQCPIYGWGGVGFLAGKLGQGLVEMDPGPLAPRLGPGTQSTSGAGGSQSRPPSGGLARAPGPRPPRSFPRNLFPLRHRAPCAAATRNGRHNRFHQATDRKFRHAHSNQFPCLCH